MQTVQIGNKEESKARIAFLQEEVTKHDMLYEQNNPIISDTEYDQLYFELVMLEARYPEFITKDSPTQRIVAVLVDSLNKVAHTTPMLSQDKVHTADDIRKFAQKSSSRIIAQHKLDGLTIVLTYENTYLVSAVTRGDGLIGEDVLHTIRTSIDVPKRINFTGRLEIRAEAIIMFEDFIRINKEREEAGLEIYATTRNLASGTTRQLDAKVAQTRNLRVISFDGVSAEGLEFKTDEEQLLFMTSLGFNVVPYEIFENTNEGIEALIEYCTTFNEKTRKTLKYDIDGLVLKFDDLAVRLELGYTSKFPRWGCAFKFESNNATTTLLNVVPQVGKTGQITPVAEFETVNIDGVSISRATLHNYGNITKKDIQLGDRILVERANDVIPQVVKSIKEVRDGNQKDILIPTHCPSCGSPTEMDGENLYCTGFDCKPQLEGKLVHFVSRKALNIDGLGEKTVKSLLSQGFISTLTDIYRLKDKEAELTSLDGFGQKKFDKMIEGIEQSKKNPLHKVLYALSIRQVGESASKDVSKTFKTMDEIIDLSQDEMAFRNKLLSIKDFGGITTDYMVDFFTNPKNIEAIRELQSFGFAMESEFDSTPAGSALEGLTFVITGSFTKDRNELKDIVESNGGKASGSVSKKTDYLLMGDGVEGKSKHLKAVELGIKIITEEEFNAML